MLVQILHWKALNELLYRFMFLFYLPFASIWLDFVNTWEMAMGQNVKTTNWCSDSFLSSVLAKERKASTTELHPQPRLSLDLRFYSLSLPECHDYGLCHRDQPHILASSSNKCSVTKDAETNDSRPACSKFSEFIYQIQLEVQLLKWKRIIRD